MSGQSLFTRKLTAIAAALLVSSVAVSAAVVPSFLDVCAGCIVMLPAGVN